MTDREQMPIDWINYLKQRMAEREHEITHNLLQVSDYPPLPECPDCDVQPTQITDRTADIGDDGLLVDFTPCGHRFKVPASELLRG
ncbi:hypothetical protein [Streptomyces echinatus]|uniref:Uncharacterized protein n=1 Tax=Streptomyces echinatus TaxID=67293 RepID=A0A7W9UV39_9ACTN|nr:hypothetical protein [Streptomyces echinatus]MBB5932283.1 hypothetical protein [Streptomyces echinatus]